MRELHNWKLKAPYSQNCLFWVSKFTRSLPRIRVKKEDALICPMICSLVGSTSSLEKAILKSSEGTPLHGYFLTHLYVMERRHLKCKYYLETATWDAFSWNFYLIFGKENIHYQIKQKLIGKRNGETNRESRTTGWSVKSVLPGKCSSIASGTWQRRQNHMTIKIFRRIWTVSLNKLLMARTVWDFIYLIKYKWCN